MNRPVYHIEGIVKAQNEAPSDFVGPLDLILHLLRRNKLAIRDIPLASILAQYLAWVEARRKLDLNVAGEFITMASQLMLLKTRTILSEQDEETQQEMETLIASLEARARQKELRQIRAVLETMEEAFRAGQGSLTKRPELRYAKRVYRYAYTMEDLCKAVNAWWKRRGEAAPLSVRVFQTVVRSEPYPVERKSAQILSLLTEEGTLSLGQMIACCGTRSEATASFLALLELCRQGKIYVAGDDQEDPKFSLVQGEEV